MITAIGNSSSICHRTHFMTMLLSSKLFAVPSLVIGSYGRWTRPFSWDATTKNLGSPPVSTIIQKNRKKRKPFCGLDPDVNGWTQIGMHDSSLWDLCFGSLITKCQSSQRNKSHWKLCVQGDHNTLVFVLLLFQSSSWLFRTHYTKSIYLP